jgi:hypothetical protein
MGGERVIVRIALAAFIAAFCAGIPMATAGGGFELVCTAGSKVKCARFGYAPWLNTPDGQSMRPLWKACNRMVRADYGGQGEATTLRTARSVSIMCG